MNEFRITNVQGLQSLIFRISSLASKVQETASQRERTSQVKNATVACEEIRKTQAAAFHSGVEAVPLAGYRTHSAENRCVIRQSRRRRHLIQVAWGWNVLRFSCDQISKKIEDVRFRSSCIANVFVSTAEFESLSLIEWIRQKGGNRSVLLPGRNDLLKNDGRTIRP